MSSLQHSTAPSPFLYHLPLRTRSVSVSWAVRLTGLSLSTSLFPFSEAQAVHLLLSCCPAPRSACRLCSSPACCSGWGAHPSIPTILLSAPARDSLLLKQALCHSGCAAPGTDAQQNSTVRVKGSGGRAGWAWEPGSSPGSCHCPGNLRNVPAGCARGPEPHPSRQHSGIKILGLPPLLSSALLRLSRLRGAFRAGDSPTWQQEPNCSHASPLALLVPVGDRSEDRVTLTGPTALMARHCPHHCILHRGCPFQRGQLCWWGCLRPRTVQIMCVLLHSLGTQQDISLPH